MNHVITGNAVRYDDHETSFMTIACMATLGTMKASSFTQGFRSLGVCSIAWASSAVDKTIDSIWPWTYNSDLTVRQE